ncbi:MAG: NAD-glutamate dehydrogenase [Parvularculaceae bacterium]|nr:NAD-glutamate dehydrogenase [Parvularculaceae bacterium]
MAEGFHSSADAKTLTKTLALAAKHKDAPKTKDGALAPAFTHYLEQLVRFATGEDRYWNEPASLLDRAVAAWKATQTRKKGSPNISFRLQKGADWRDTRLVLEIATDDMPFIVDSVTSALAEAGKPVSFFVNAVVNVARDAKGARLAEDAGKKTIAESMIHAEMDPPVEDGEIAILESEIQAVLADVATAVADFEAMRARMKAAIDGLERTKPKGVDKATLSESAEFLKMLWENKFTFLGVRRYDYSVKGSKKTFVRDEAADLGILKDSDRRVLKTTFSDEGALSPSVAGFMASNEPLIITKANTRSTVHRRVHMDYIGVKTYDDAGKVTGEERFVGLLTSDMYNRPASDIPILRIKEKAAVEAAGFRAGGHNQKALVHILETFPRDEMFQSDVDTLMEMALGILRLYKRPRSKLFLRRDRFDRFISALVYVPRDRFSSAVREQIGDKLAKAFDGYVAAFNPHFGDASLVRVHFIIGISPGAPEGPGVADLTRSIRAITRNWSDGLLDALRDAHEGATPLGLYSRWEYAFDAAYRERNTPVEALDDIAVIESMGESRLALRAFRRAGAPENEINIKLYCRREPHRLSDLIPPIEHLGLNVVHESGYSITPGDEGAAFWVHDFRTEDRLGRTIDAAGVKKLVEDAFGAILDGRTEDDGFNALVVSARLNWRETWYLRAAAKYLLQAGIPFSQNYIEETLARHPEISRALIAVFHTRFNPAGPAKLEQRVKELDKAVAAIKALLENVQSLDEDRIFRRYLNLILSTVRTNYFQRNEDGSHKPYISFKIVSAGIDDLPEPRPYREIFMSGPKVDGVHLRFGAVARGGLRWSDRREDFRTEVLGLVKAQRVKNAVIVPTGSKGGFYPKQLPVGGDRNAVFEEGRDAYKQFIRSLLDITDNIVAGKTVTPADVVRWDDQDPYLVVAADKGTATFSDTANGISADYGFWLGDAFASGGSAGYDHKVMGITARGGWEAVKRHFREIGKDIQKEPFTVAGVGDMSGDVFGNGMLLSEQIRLIAAFDHRDIFFDPNPDTAKSYAERKRLFDLPRSSWADYDKKLISKGGGVFSRSAKSIPLSAEMKAQLELSQDAATPQEVMKAILKLPVELFWLGGIGTYFKAAHEENSRVGDRANDAMRINAEEMRMKVVGEGANLGATQAARIAFALSGGRINTDAIDNSAGVDSSDHEVNIKILLSAAIENGELKASARNSLLKKMTEDVAQHVLAHNYDQTRALSLMQVTAAQDINAYARFMSALEAQGRLDRVVEGLPDDKAIAARKTLSQGLTRPELSVLLAYAKMHIYETLLESKAPDDPSLGRELNSYFPEETHKFTKAIAGHRLKREIIATRLSNEIVDTCGATFVNQLMEVSGASVPDIALSYEAARRILELRSYGGGVDALDNKAPAELQTDLYNTAVDLLAEQVNKIVSDVEASNVLAKRGVAGLVEQYKEPIQSLKKALPDILPPAAAQALKTRVAYWRQRNAPNALADQAALMPALEFAFDIVNLARETKWSSGAVGGLFFAAGHRFHIEAARAAAKAAMPEGHFDQLAVRRLIDELSMRQGALTRTIAGFAKTEPKGAAKDWLDPMFAEWRAKHSTATERYEKFAAELDIGAGMSVGKLSLLSTKLADLVERTGGK